MFREWFQLSIILYRDIRESSREVLTWARTMVFEQQKSRTVLLGTDERHGEGPQLKLRDFRMGTKSLEFGPLFN